MRLLLLLLLCVGCSAPVRDYSGEFVPVIAIACGAATVGSPATPDAPAFDCATCEDKGRLPIRDTGRFEDCPDCDLDTPISATILNDPQSTPELAEPVVEWLTWPEAADLAKETGRPVLVLQKFRSPADDAACLPCQRLNKTLADPATLAEFAKLGIPCIGIAEEWQSGSPTAPTIAYVSPGAAPSDKVHSLSGFRVSPADAFLTDLRTWLDGLEK
jgi:hypothetical protein